MAWRAAANNQSIALSLGRTEQVSSPGHVEQEPAEALLCISAIIWLSLVMGLDFTLTLEFTARTNLFRLSFQRLQVVGDVL